MTRERERNYSYDNIEKERTVAIRRQLEGIDGVSVWQLVRNNLVSSVVIEISIKNTSIVFDHISTNLN